MGRKGQFDVGVRCADQLGSHPVLPSGPVGLDFCYPLNGEKYLAQKSICSYELLRKPVQGTVHRFKDHILQLARAEVREDIEQLRNDALARPAAQVATRR